MNINRIVSAVVVLVLFCNFHSSAQSNGKSDIIPSETFDGGVLHMYGEFSVLDLHGSFRQMGRQYGFLLKDKLHEFYDIAINEQCLKNQGLTYEKLLEKGHALFRFYPQRFKEILFGMAETSGMELDKHIILNAVEWYPWMCSYMAAWSDYTAEGKLVVGRNYDYSPYFRDYSKFLTVAVFHPEDGSFHTAVITYCGTVYAVNGINEEGLFLALNSGGRSAGMFEYTNRIHAEISLFTFLLDYSTMNQIDAAFQTTRSSFAYIINVADKNEAYSFEWPTFGVKKRPGERNGILAATNYFVDQSWGLPFPDDKVSSFSIKRRMNLLAMGGKYKGSLDEKIMMNVLDTTIENGGATFPDKTIYQIVIVPEDFKLWLKAPLTQDWTDIHLKKYLKP